MSQVAASMESGWRPDPSGRYEWRYWDGGWTNRVANSAPRDGAARERADRRPPPRRRRRRPSPDPTAPAAPAAAAVPVAAGVSARDAVARAPFGPDDRAATGADRAGADADPSHPVGGRSPGSSARSPTSPSPTTRPWRGTPLPPDARGEQMVSAVPGNYGHSGIVALAACGIVAGAYLPWISGTIGIVHFHRSGFDDGLGLGYSIGAMALAISALLSVRMRVFRWLTVVLSFVLAGFVVRDVLHSYDAMQTMNQSRAVDANVGWGSGS